MSSEEIPKVFSDMVCLNCKHYDTIWFNCKFLGFDGVRENPNGLCNIEITVNGQKQLAFIHKNTAELKFDQKIMEDLVGESKEK